MKIPTSPSPLQFSARFKSTNKQMVISGGALISTAPTVTVNAPIALTVSGMAGPLAGVGSSLGAQSGAFFSANTAFNAVFAEKVREPIVKEDLSPPVIAIPKDPRVVAIETALGKLRQERIKQIKLRDQVIAAYEKENDKLADLRRRLDSPDSTLGQTNSIDDAVQAYQQMGTNIKKQEAIVAEMKKNADAARVLDQQLEGKMKANEQEYHTMLSRIQQTQQNEDVAQMQRSLEALERKDLPVSDEIAKVKDQVDLDYYKSVAQIEDTVNQATAQIETKAKENAAALEILQGEAAKADKNKQSQ